MIKRVATIHRRAFFARHGAPVFLNSRGEVCLRREAGPGSKPIMIVSVPKSGTYLFGALLEAIGVRATNVHVATYGFQDLRYVPKEFAINHPRETFVMIPSERVLPLVRPGQYAVSHFPCTEEIWRQLAGFDVIFTSRDLRDTLVSTMRWVARLGQGAGSPEGWEGLPEGPAKMEQFVERHGKHYLDSIKVMRDWPDQPGVLPLSFEELQGDFGASAQRETVRRILDLLERSLPAADIGRVIEQTLGRDTLTFSGSRSRRADLWSDAVEDSFRASGAVELDAFFKSRLARRAVGEGGGVFVSADPRRCVLLKE